MKYQFLNKQTCVLQKLKTIPKNQKNNSHQEMLGKILIKYLQNIYKNLLIN